MKLKSHMTSRPTVRNSPWFLSAFFLAFMKMMLRACVRLGDDSTLVQRGDGGGQVCYRSLHLRIEDAAAVPHVILETASCHYRYNVAENAGKQTPDLSPP